jgi:glycosyltransferase involved in cell wall biosynthesis
LFDGAAAFVLPSRSENFGIVVAEAMARGCAVVITEGVQASSHVQRAGAGIVVPYGADALAHAIDDLLANHQRRSTFGAAARQYVTSHLTWDRVAAQIQAMYESLPCVQSRRVAECQEHR